MTLVNGIPVRSELAYLNDDFRATVTTSSVTTRTCGMGDIVVRGRFYVVDEHGWLPTVAVRAHVKAPTASAEQGLGTGEPDEGTGLEVSRTFASRTTAMVDGGYTSSASRRRRLLRQLVRPRRRPGHRRTEADGTSVLFEEYPAIAPDREKRATCWPSACAEPRLAVRVTGELGCRAARLTIRSCSAQAGCSNIAREQPDDVELVRASQQETASLRRADLTACAIDPESDHAHAGARRREDVAQETFIAAHKALPSFKLDSKFSTWLYRIGVNKCTDSLRSRRPGNTSLDVVSDDGAVALAVADDETPLRELEQAELAWELDRGIQGLPQVYRESFVLRHIEGLGYEEMSAILGVHRDTLKMRVYKARTLLCQSLAHLDGAYR